MPSRPAASRLKPWPFCLNFADCLASPSLGVLVCTDSTRFWEGVGKSCGTSAPRGRWTHRAR